MLFKTGPPQSERGSALDAVPVALMRMGSGAPPIVPAFVLLHMALRRSRISLPAFFELNEIKIAHDPEGLRPRLVLEAPESGGSEV